MKLLTSTAVPAASLVALGVLFGVWGAWPGYAQQTDGLVWEYVRARTHALAEQHLQETGGRVAPRSATMLAAPRSDSIRQVLLALFAEPEEDAPPVERSFEVHHTYLAGKFERSWYQRRYGDVRWSYLGANGRGALDTLWTRDLRARLQARFGPPTQRLTDISADSLRKRDDFPQFEYWFVLNGSVPFMVMDTNGPFERGLVVATDHRYRDRLVVMRKAFLGPLVQQQERGAYTDYYFDREGGAWYRIQFDGETYDLQPERPPHSRTTSLLERLRARESEANQ